MVAAEVMHPAQAEGLHNYALYSAAGYAFEEGRAGAEYEFYERYPRIDIYKAGEFFPRLRPDEAYKAAVGNSADIWVIYGFKSVK